MKSKFNGKDLPVPLSITFEESISSCENVLTKTVKVDRDTLCADCGGSKSKPGSEPL